MFRNPVEMLHSFHAQLLYVAEESESDFETAWRLQEQRSRGIGLPPRSRGAFLVQYRELGRFGTQTERLLSIFPREQVKLILYDDFAASPQAVYDDVIEFLGIPHDGRTEFPAHQRGQARAARLAARLLPQAAAPAPQRLPRPQAGRRWRGHRAPSRERSSH